MVSGFWGSKIGMTQVFDADKVVPATVIDVSSWVIVGQKTQERDEYDAVIVGKRKKPYVEQLFKKSWLKDLKKYFSAVREIPLQEGTKEEFTVGNPVNFAGIVTEGDMLDVSGKTRGRGFAGVMKRYGFSGGPASHGGKLGRRPGSLSFMRSQGRVIKGKKLPGHLGNVKRMIRNLDVVKVESDRGVVLVKGSIPGKSGSLVFLRKV
jgi:large subunit ribosomal protein L3